MVRPSGVKAIAPLLFIVSCAGAPAPHVASAPPAAPSIAGRIVDARGAPIAGAEVLVCAGDNPCAAAYHRAMESAEPLAKLAGAPSAAFVVATTDADGRWRTPQPVFGPELPIHNLLVVATAPGHEVLSQGARARELGTQQPDDDFVLRDAYAVDVEPDCGAKPCPERVTVDRLFRTHCERVIAGTYAWHVVANPEAPGEMEGTAEVVVESSAVRVPVELGRTGTGKWLTGHVRGWPENLTELMIEANCSGIVRRTTMKAQGGFYVEDVGPPPCVVAATGTIPRLCGECPPGETWVEVHAEVAELPGNVTLTIGGKY